MRDMVFWNGEGFVNRMECGSVWVIFRMCWVCAGRVMRWVDDDRIFFCAFGVMTMVGDDWWCFNELGDVLEL